VVARRRLVGLDVVLGGPAAELVDPDEAVALLAELDLGAGLAQRDDARLRVGLFADVDVLQAAAGLVGRCGGGHDEHGRGAGGDGGADGRGDADGAVAGDHRVRPPGSGFPAAGSCSEFCTVGQPNERRRYRFATRRTDHRKW
jgi:hypothetical protein